MCLPMHGPCLHVAHMGGCFEPGMASNNTYMHVNRGQAAQPVPLMMYWVHNWLDHSGKEIVVPQ
jgi:hypothetical protein